jgi:ferritin-like metal-binding protein YciE
MISNPRDLAVQLLGEILFVERRLADRVLDELRAAVQDEELRDVLAEHLDETRHHVERVETAFRRLDVAATSNLSRPFESAVAEHDERARSITATVLADLFHAHAALVTEHWEMAAYRTVLPLLPREAAELVQPSYREEGDAAKRLLGVIDRLARADRR